MIISNHSMQSLRLLKLSCYLYCFCGCTHMSTTSCLHTNTVRDPSYNGSIENLLTCRLGHDLKPMWSFNFIRIFRVVLLFNYQGSVCFQRSLLFLSFSPSTFLVYHACFIMSTIILSFIMFYYLFLHNSWLPASSGVSFYNPYRKMSSNTLIFFKLNNYDFFTCNSLTFFKCNVLTSTP